MKTYLPCGPYVMAFCVIGSVIGALLETLTKACGFSLSLWHSMLIVSVVTIPIIAWGSRHFVQWLWWIDEQAYRVACWISPDNGGGDGR